MKVRLIDTDTPRSDGRDGKPTGVSEGKVYNVAEVLDTQYSIINDDYKICRYSKTRFAVVDDSPVKPLREAFNEFTHEMRMEVKELRQNNEELSSTKGQEATQALDSLKTRLENSYVAMSPSVNVAVKHVFLAIDMEIKSRQPLNLRGN